MSASYSLKDRWVNSFGHEFRIIAESEGYYMIRYKGCIPFVKRVKEFPKFLKDIEAKPKPKQP